jgi:hypothetical protein
VRLSGRRRAATLALLLFLGVSALAAEEGTPIPTADFKAAPEKAKAENPLLRFEIVTLGSYPISMFYIGIVYDVMRYYDNDRDPAYAPWPFNNGSSSVALDNSERVERLKAALYLSLSVGVIDVLIHATKVQKAKRLREAMMSAAPENAGPSTPSAPEVTTAPEPPGSGP